MNWLRKNNPFEDSRDRSGSQEYVVGSRHATSMPPQRGGSNGNEVPQIFRTYSASSRSMADPPSYANGYENDQRYDNYGRRYENADENLFRTASNTYDFNAVMTTPVTEPGQASNEVTETSEETLVKIHGAMVHLVDDQESPFLAEGSFSVVRIEQEGNGIVAFVRVGDNLRWPLTKDEPAGKLDSTHYFFTIRVPRPVDEMDKATADSNGNETLSYGVTFSVSGQERQMRELDSLLEQYSNFSSPQLVRGDKQQILPQEVVSSEGKQVTVSFLIVLIYLTGL